MIDKQTANLIKERADIVEVVSDYVHLVKRGANYMGLCPFHNERTPSFSVNKRKNFCYCFSCHKGGSPVNFLMEKEGVSYHDALLMLAQKYGITVEERELTDEERQRQTEREAMTLANRWAMQRMEHYLTETQEGRDIGLSYFDHRGITDEARKAFHLGYSPEKAWTLVDDARKEGQNMDALTQLGLIGHRQKDGKPYDRFHSRVIFPIFNTAGIVVAFGGRDIKGESPAKYINSTESLIYDKSRELYGLYQGKSAIRRNDRVYLVEGYMDVIGMWQSGLENVVASCGTALTPQQIGLIQAQTSNVTIIYDGDNAGIKATLRAIDMFLTQGLDIKMLLLPDGHDPDSFARSRSAEEFTRYVEEHSEDFIDYKLRVSRATELTDPSARARVIRSIIDSIACIPDGIKRTEYVRACSERMKVPAETLMVETEAQYKRQIRQAEIREKNKQPATPTPQPNRQETPGNTNPGQTPISATSPARALSSQIPALEATVLRYAVKYGMVDFCDGVDEQGNVVTMNVAQYIKAELDVDGITFQLPAHTKILETVIGLEPDFRESREQLTRQLAAEHDQLRQQEYDRIATEGLDSEGIAAAEAALAQKIEEQTLEALREHACGYVAGLLASDADGEIRTLVTQMIMPHHQLSAIYRRNGYTTTEFDRLSEYVPRALSELKTAILETKIAELRAGIQRASAAGESDELLRLQQELTDLFNLRRQAALTIGERIINPRK